MASVIADTASKAAVLDTDMVHMSVPIEKTEDTEAINPVDGTPDVVVTGKCTDGTLDSDLQVVDPDASARWIKTWFDTGANIRAAHDPKWPAGRGLSLDPHDPHRIKVLVADPRAKHLVRQKVLKDFSIGIMHPDVRKGDPRFRHLDPTGKAVNGVITDRPDGLTGLGEISLVDRGANYGSAFSLVKAAADGSPEWVGEMVGDGLAAGGLITKDGAAHVGETGTVTVELPKDVSVSISPTDLAKLATFKQRLTVEKATGSVPAVSAAEPAAPPPPEPAADVDLPVAVKALIAAETAIYKRDIDTATRRRLAAEGKALPNLCLAAETPVVTPTGLRAISDMVGPCRVLTDHGWADAEVRQFGVQELRAVILRRGAKERTVYATPNHRWYLIDGTVKVTDELGAADAIGYVDVAEFSHGEKSERSSEAWSDAPGMHEVRATAAAERVLHEGNAQGSAVSAARLQVVREAALAGMGSGLQDSAGAAGSGVGTADPPYVRTDAGGRFGDAETPALPLPAVPRDRVQGRTLQVAGRGPRSRHGRHSRVALQLLQPATWLGGGRRNRADSRVPGWNVVAVAATRRIEAVYCAVVPGLHRFVLADGILTGNSYPIENEEDLHNAATLARSGHGNVAAARRLIGRRARALGVANPLKGGKKADKAAAVVCDLCKNTGRTLEGPCPVCEHGTKAAKADAKAARKAVEAEQRKAAADAEAARKAAVAERRKALAAMVAEAVAEADAVKKDKVVCPSCGAKQNAKHRHCPECGNMLPGDAIQVRKNHDFTCLGCGKDLDKGEKFCPECGRENPGYLPEADRKIPANEDADKAAKGKKNPFGGRKAPPFGDDDDDSPRKKGKKGARVTKAAKKGRGPTPGDGVVGQHESPVPRHREPDGPDVEAFESDAHLEDGDSEAPSHLAARMGKGSEEMAAAMRLKSLNVPYGLGQLHDLTCPAYDPADVAKAHPGATVASMDLSAFQADAISSAATMTWDDLSKGTGLWDAATALKAADPFEVNQAREAAYKSFRELNPGPSSFPTPGEISATQFRRPLITAGHEAPSPGHQPPNSAKVPPPGGIEASDFQRGFIQAGHASESPANQHTAPPVQAPAHTGAVTGEPARYAFERGAQASHEHAMRVIHDHISGIYPGLCPAPLSPDPVPTPNGVPPVAGAPAKKKTVKARKPVTPKQAAKKAAAKRAKLERQVLKGQLSVTDFREKIGLTATPAPPASPVVPVPGLDPDQVKSAVTEASAPLNKRLAKQNKALKRARKAAATRDRMIRKQRKTLKALTAAAAEAAAAQAVPETAEDPAVTGMLLKSAMADAAAPLKRKIAKQDKALKRANKAVSGQDRILRKQHKMLTALAELGTPAPAAPAEPDMPADMRTLLLDMALKTALTEATAPLAKQLKASQKAQKAQARELRKVKRTADAIAAQPDTTGAPFRGVLHNKSNSGAPEGPLSVAKSAEQVQANFMSQLVDQWRNDPNPAMRQAAFDDILSRTLDPQATQPTA